MPQHGDDPFIGDVLDALRRVVEPRERPLMPSPFGTAVQPEREAPVESTPAPAA